MTTLRDLMQRDRDVLLPEEVAEYLHLSPQRLRAQAREDPSKLGFRVIVCGNKTLIPKRPFIEYIGGSNGN